jgi:hypothetical protein
MKGVSRLFFTIAVLYALLGMLLGLKMGMSGVHDQIPTHAHIMLVGWVSSALIAYFYHHFPAAGASGLAMGHFILHALGSIVLTIALWIVYAGNKDLELVAGLSSIAVFLGMLIFAYLALRDMWKA